MPNTAAVRRLSHFAVLPGRAESVTGSPLEGAQTVGKIGVGAAGGVVAQLVRAYYGI